MDRLSAAQPRARPRWDLQVKAAAAAVNCMVVPDADLVVPYSDTLANNRNYCYYIGSVAIAASTGRIGE